MSAHPEPIEVTEYDPAWPSRFGAAAAALRDALGDGRARRRSR
jgi:GrpB-like predicted nucleotidyltransferase (UPF0157 family)